MKRFITLFSAVALVATLSAQDVTVTYNGKAIENGSTLTVGFENNGLWESKPDLKLTVTSEMTAGIQATFTDGKHVQICPAPEGEIGQCITATQQGDIFIAQNNYELTPEKTILLNLHWTDDFVNLGAAECPEVNTSATVSITRKMHTIFSFTVVFDSKYTAGIDNIAGDGSFVSLAAGNILEYNVPEGTKLDIYSINGSTVLERTVNGHGSLSLDRLAPGVYLYKAGKLSGKVLVK